MRRGGERGRERAHLVRGEQPLCLQQVRRGGRLDRGALARLEAEQVAQPVLAWLGLGLGLVLGFGLGLGLGSTCCQWQSRQLRVLRRGSITLG